MIKMKLENVEEVVLLIVLLLLAFVCFGILPIILTLKDVRIGLIFMYFVGWYIILSRDKLEEERERGCYKMSLEEVFKRREKYLVLNKPKNWKVRLTELKELKRLVLRGD